MTCSSTTAGAVQWTGTILQYCSGTAWVTVEASGSNSGIYLGASASTPNPAASASDLTTGLYTSGAGHVDVTSVGTQIADFSGTGLNLITGNLGIGTSSPTELLTAIKSDSTVYTSASTTLLMPWTAGAAAVAQIYNSSPTNGDGAYIDLAATNTAGNKQRAYIGAVSTTGSTTYTPALAFGLQTGSAAYNEYMRIGTNGYVGIGTVLPASALSIYGGGLGVGTSAGTTTMGIGSATFSGNVGIGVTPGSVYSLQLSGGAFVGDSIYLNDGKGVVLGGSVGTGLFVSHTNGTTIKDSGITTVIFMPSGLVGIGTTTPQNKLDVFGGIAVGSTSGYAGIGTAPANGMIVAGSVGIGTTTPQSKLDIAGSIVVGTTYAGVTPAPANGAIIQGITQVGGYNSGNYGKLMAFSSQGTAGYGSQFASSAAGTAQGQVAVYSFFPTFQGTADNGPRRAADISGAFNNGWGSEYLTFNVGENGASNDSQSFTIERMRITGAGNVGIGTTTPQNKLDVYGGVAIGSTSGYAGIGTAPANGMIVAGSVGVGTASPNAPLTIVGTPNFGIAKIIGSGESDIAFHTSGIADGAYGDWLVGANIGGTPTTTFSIYEPGMGNVLAISSSGLVGIGTSTPASLLTTYDSGVKTAAYTGVLHDVFDTSVTASIAKIGEDIESTGSWTGTNTGLVVNATGGGTNYAATFSGGNVGIGTTSPIGALSVNAAGVNALSVGISTNQANTTAQISGTITAIAPGTTGLSAVGAVATDYYNNGSSPSYAGTLMDYYGSGASGNIIGVSKANLGVLIFQNESAGLIYNNSTQPIYFGFGANTSPSITFSQFGNVGIGSTAPIVSLDFTGKNDAILLPNGSSASRPTGSALANAEIRYNTGLSAVEYYNGSIWVSLQSSGSTSGIYLGTAAAYTNPSRNGDITTGLYTANAGEVDISGSSTQIASFTSSGINIGTGGLNIAGVNGISFPKDYTTDASIAIGSGALASQPLGTSGNAPQANIAIGYQAMGSTGLLATAVQNTAVGYQALQASTSANQNTAIGFNAMLFTTSGNNSTAVGAGALNRATSASANTALGAYSAYYTTGNNNTMLGYDTGTYVTTGNNNTALGQNALEGITGNRITGSYNTAVGNNTLVNLQSAAANNTALGYYVGGGTLSTGSSNILIGVGSEGTAGAADTPASSTSNYLNIGNTIEGSTQYATAIGSETLYLQSVSGSVNYVSLSGGATGTGPTIATAGGDSTINLTLSPKGSGNTLIPTGSVGIGTASPIAPLSIAGEAYSYGGTYNGFRVSSTLGDDTNNAPWYGIGQTNMTFSGGSGTATQLAGYFGLNLKTAIGQIAMTQFGLVGIGTATPKDELDVYGGVAIGSGGYAGVATAPTNGMIVAGSVGVGTTAPAFYSGAGGIEIGTGVNGGQAELKLDNAAGASGYLSIWTNRMELASSTAISLSAGYVGYNQFWLTTSGLVGIGTTSPNSLLSTYDSGVKTAAYTGVLHDVFDTSVTASIAKIGEDIESTGSWTGTNTGLVVNATGGGTANYAATFSGGNVGIGTTSPATNLWIEANTNSMAFTLNNTQTGGHQWQIKNNGGSSIVPSSFYFYDYTGGLNPFAVNGSDNVGIGGNISPSTLVGADMVLLQSGLVGIGTTAPIASLDFTGKTDAILLPQGASSVRPTGANLGNGEIRYNTGLSAVEYYNGSIWVSLQSSGSSSGIYLGASASTPNPAASASDTTTGLYTSGAGHVDVSSASSQIADFSSGGFDLVTGKLTIGTTTPIELISAEKADSTLYVSSSATVAQPWTSGSGAVLQAYNTSSTSGDGAYIDLAATNASGNEQRAYIADISTAGSTTYTPSLAFGIQTGSTAYNEYMRIGTNGYVGIGTTSPSYALTVWPTGTTSSPTTIGFPGNTGSYQRFALDSANGLQSVNGGRTQIFSYWGAEIHGYDYTGGTPTFAAGASSDAALTIFGGYGNANPVLNIVNNAGTSTFMTVGSTGSVGIGTASPLAELNLDNGGTATTDALRIGNSSKYVILQDTGAAIDLTSGGTALYVNNNVNGNVYLDAGTSTGVVGIGTATVSSSNRLEINGSASIGYTNTAAPTNGMIVAGSVGIGTTGPAGALEVSNSYSGTTQGGEAFITNTYSSGSGTRVSDLTFRLTDSVGTKKPVAMIQALSNNNDSSNGDNLLFYTRTADATPTEKVRIDNNGNVGIGTTTPQNKLDVFGGIAVGSTSGYAGIGTAPANGMIVAGSVGIGTASPTYTLNVYTSNSNGLALQAGGRSLTFDSGGLTTNSTITGGGSWGSVAEIESYTLASRVGMMVRGATGQTSDLAEWQNINGTTLVNITAVGSVGIGTTSPIVSLDLSQKQDAIALPYGGSAVRPTGTNLTNGEIRYNTGLSAVEYYNGSVWVSLQSSGSTSGIYLGTAAAYTNPSRNGDITTGLYTANAGEVDISGSSTQIASFTSSGINIGTGSLKLAGQNGISFPPDYPTDASIAIGSGALASQPLGTSGNAPQANIAIGYQAMGSTGLLATAVQNTAIGYQAATKITNGYANVAVGWGALSSATTGYANTAVGDGAIGGVYGNGAGNSALGYEALQNVGNASNSSSNTAIGQKALASMTGSGNTAIGNYAGSNITSSTNNTLVGNSVASTTLSTGSYNILIGVNSVNNAGGADTPTSSTSNYLNIGNTIEGSMQYATAIGSETLYLNSVNGSVNYVSMSGGATGTGPTIATAGGDTNINLTLSPKGSGNTLIPTGSVGIGTPSPAAILTTYKPSSSGGTQVVEGMRIVNHTVGGETAGQQYAGLVLTNDATDADVFAANAQAWALRAQVVNSSSFSIVGDNGTSTFIPFYISGATGTVGYVGIGTTSVGSPLTVYGSNVSTYGTTIQIIGNATNQVDITPTFNTWGLLLGADSSSQTASLYHGSNYAYLINVQNAPLMLGANNAVDMTFLPSGYVGIGTSSPQVILDVTGSLAATAIGTEDEFHITRNVNPSASYPQVASFQLGTYTANSVSNSYGPSTRLDIDLKAAKNNTLTGDTNVMTLLSSGYVGIGTTSPQNKLDVYGGVAIGSATGYAGSTAAPTNGMIVAGSVGIGTAAPGYTLDVNGSMALGNNQGASTYRLYLARGDVGNYIYSTGTGNNSTYFGEYGNVNGNGWHFIDTNSTGERLSVMATTGNVGIGSTLPIVSLDFTGKTDAILLPQGASSVRPTGTALGNGEIRYNTGLSAVEYYNGSVWVSLQSSGSSSGIYLGTAAAYTNPSRNGDLTTGLYTANAGEVDISGSGTQVASFTTTKTVIPVGSVGIGNSSPQATLHVYGNTGSGTGVMIFYAPGTTQFTPSGGVTTSPASLVIGDNSYAGNAGTTGALSIYNNNGFSPGGNNSIFWVGYNGNIGIDIGSVSSNPVPLSALSVSGGVAIGTTYATGNAAASNNLIVQGSTGIGTTTPVNKLDVYGGVAVGSTAGYAGSTAAPANGMIVAGSVGIGNSAPSNLLQVGSGLGSFLINSPTGNIINAAINSPIASNVMFQAGTTGYGTFSSASVTYGIATAPVNAGAGSIVGVSSAPVTTYAGAVSSLYAVQGGIRVAGTGETVASGYDFYAATPTMSAGAVSSMYGLYIQPQTGTGITNSYGVYQTGASDNNYFAGSVGIGTASPQNALDVYGGIAVGSASGYAGSTAAPANGMIVAGSVGINVSAPTNRLTVNNTSGATNLSTSVAAATFGNTNTTTNNFTGISFNTLDLSSTYTVATKIASQITSHATGAVSADIVFGTMNAGSFFEAMRMSSAGNLGIGSSSPVVSLDLSQKSDAIALPYGGSAARPTGTNLTNGEIRYNTGLSAVEYYNGSTWVSLAAGSVAGGTANYVARWLGSSSLGTGTLVDNGTQVGIGTASPATGAALDVTGSIYSRSVNASSATTINWASGNEQYTTASCGAFSFSGMVDGGSYTLLVEGTTSGTCSFSNTDSPTLAFRLPTNHGATTAGTMTMYNFTRLGTYVIVTWMPGYSP